MAESLCSEPGKERCVGRLYQIDISPGVIPHSTRPRPCMIEIKYCDSPFSFLEMPIKPCHYKQLSAWPWPSKFRFLYYFPDITVGFIVIGSGNEWHWSHYGSWQGLGCMTVPEIWKDPSWGYQKAKDGNYELRYRVLLKSNSRLRGGPVRLQFSVTFSLVNHGGKINVFIIWTIRLYIPRLAWKFGHTDIASFLH